jgi:pimeloyl-ACP methyl ester carboxylesterase
MIEFHFAILKSSNKNKAPDPIVVLQGGPGSYALDNADWMISIFSTALAFRDIILFDQRGVGYSQPSLNCPELEEPFYANFAQDLSAVEETEKFNQALKTCRDRLVREGVDLNQYNSATSAADLDDLLHALGYDQWNLYGISYGTRLALTVMRDHPVGVRSVILDSVYPPHVDLFTSFDVDMQRALDLLFQRCAQDDECNQDYPNLEIIFYEVVYQVEAQPVTLSINNPHDGKAYDVVFNADRLILAIHNLLYNVDNLSILPAIIYEIHAGDWEQFSSLVRWGQFLHEDMSEGLYFSVQCVEELPLSFPAGVETDNSGVNSYLSSAFYKAQYDQHCAIWQVTPAAAIENQAVVSDIPTLILAGEHDPITPPLWGKTTAETLSRAQFIEFPGVGHAVFGSFSGGVECSLSKMINNFLAEPEKIIDTSCIAEAPVLFATDD